MPVTIAFVSQKGGVGKSALARSTAVALARAKINVLIGDCDAQQSTTLLWNRRRAEQRSKPDITVVSAETAAEIFDRGKTFEVIVLDMPGRANRVTLDAVRHAHIIVQPTGPTLDDLYPGVLLFHELAAAGIPKRRFAFALCRTLGKSEEDAARRYLEQSGYEVLAGSLAEKIEYRAALNLGAALIESGHKDLDARASAIVDAILRKVNEEVDVIERDQRSTARTKG